MTSPYPPLINCPIGVTGKDTTNFTGLDINLIRQVIQKMNITSSEWDFQCINFEEWETKISDTQTYLGFAGALTIDYQRVSQGVLFSEPYWNTGLSVLTYSKVDGWIFLNVLTVNLCLIIVATAFLIGLITYFFERYNTSLEYYLWNSFANIFFVTTINLKKSASRMVQISFWFMILIVLSYLIAQLTNILTIDQMINRIISPHSLNQKKVKTYTIYNDIMYGYGAKPVDTKFGKGGEYDKLDFGVITLDMIVNDLSRQDDFKVDAFVIDDNLAKVVEYTYCEIFLNARLFHQFSYAFAYHPNQEASWISNLNQAIQYVIEDNRPEENLRSYLISEYGSKECIKSDNLDQISIQQVQQQKYYNSKVSGLFILQGVTASIALILWGFRLLPIYPKVQKFLEDKNLITKQLAEEEKAGDEYVLENSKMTIQKIMKQYQVQIEQRIDQMDQKIESFYNMLLDEEYAKKQRRIAKQIDHIEGIIENQGDKSKTKSIDIIKADSREQEQQDDEDDEDEDNDSQGSASQDQHLDKDETDNVLDKQPQVQSDEEEEEQSSGGDGEREENKENPVEESKNYDKDLSYKQEYFSNENTVQDGSKQKSHNNSRFSNSKGKQFMGVTIQKPQNQSPEREGSSVQLQDVDDDHVPRNPLNDDNIFPDQNYNSPDKIKKRSQDNSIKQQKDKVAQGNFIDLGEGVNRVQSDNEIEDFENYE